jgi:hypothetical protein
MPPMNPEASRRWGARRATQMRTAPASGRMKSPIDKPLMRLKLVRKPATIQSRSHVNPRPPTSLRCRHIKTAAIATRIGQARINPMQGYNASRPVNTPAFRSMPVDSPAQASSRSAGAGRAHVPLKRPALTRPAVHGARPDRTARWQGLRSTSSRPASGLHPCSRTRQKRRTNCPRTPLRRRAPVRGRGRPQT